MKKTIFICFALMAFVHSAKAQQLYSLEQCRQLALEQNAQMKIAANKTMMAKQEKREAVTNFFPSISLSGGAMKADDGLKLYLSQRGSACRSRGGSIFNSQERKSWITTIPP